MPGYKVGYGKPPRKNRFKKGTSGNPKGRPKSTPNVKTSLENMLKTPITVREGDSSRPMGALDAVLMGLLGKAIKGHVPSARALLELIAAKFPEPEGEPSAPLSAADEAVVSAFLARHGVKKLPVLNTAKPNKGRKGEP